MKKIIKNLWWIAIIVAILGFVFWQKSDKQAKSDDLSTKIEKEAPELRVGYMTSWAEGAFAPKIMKEAGIAERNNLNIKYEKFQYGPPMVEAALAKKIDLFFVGWVPAVNLMTKSDDWMIIGKNSYFPIEVMAKEGSGISEIKDLKGKKLAIPYATGPYPVVINSLKKNGLEPGKDVEIINIKPTEMGAALKTSQVDAIAWGEPMSTLFEQQNLAYTFKDYDDISFILISKSFVEKNPEEVKKFMKAFQESQFYFSQNKKQAFEWFSQESQFDISLVEALGFNEPNFNAKSIDDIDLSIKDEWIEATQEKIDFEFSEKIIDKKINIKEKINQSYLP